MASVAFIVQYYHNIPGFSFIEAEEESENEETIIVDIINDDVSENTYVDIITNDLASDIDSNIAD
jgi:hypothetical protein